MPCPCFDGFYDFYDFLTTFLLVLTKSFSSLLRLYVNCIGKFNTIKAVQGYRNVRKLFILLCVFWRHEERGNDSVRWGGACCILHQRKNNFSCPQALSSDKCNSFVGNVRPLTSMKKWSK